MSRGISVARHEAKLRTILGMRGSGLLPTIADYLGGLVVLESDRPEWRYAGGERLVGIFHPVSAPAAGQFEFFQLFNPLTSGVLVVISLIHVMPRATTQSDFNFSIHDTELGGTLLASALRDSRMFQGQAVATNVGFAARCRELSAAAPPGLAANFGGEHHFTSAPLGSTPWREPVIIHPGFGMLISPGAVDLSYLVNVAWAETPLESGTRT